MYTLSHLTDNLKEDWQSEDRPKLVTIASVRDQARLFEEPICKLLWTNLDVPEIIQRLIVLSRIPFADSQEELSSDPDYRSDEGRSQDEEDGVEGRGGPRLDFSELRKKLVIDEKMMPPLQSPNGSTMTDSQGLIVPKKLINPCVVSMDRQNLHRELMFNNKV